MFPEIPLVELCDPSRRITYGIVKVGEFVPDGVPVIRGGDIRDGEIGSDDEKRVSREVSARFKRTILRGGEIVLNLISEPGHSAVVPNRLAGANVTRDVAVIPVNRADTRFVNCFLQSPQCIAWLRAHLQGSVTLKINLGTLTRLPVPNPPLGEQRRIAWIVGTLDEMIASNRQLARLLEDTVGATFRARFADFVGMNDFDDSAIGPIPQGWEVRPVGEVLDIVGGATPSTKQREYWDDGQHCWVTPKDLSGHSSPVLLGSSRHITDAAVGRISSGLLPPETVLLSSRAPVGYTVLSKIPVAINQGFIAVRPSERIPSEFVLFWLRHNMETIKANASGTTFAEISKRAFRPIPMLVPPEEAVVAFRDLAHPVFNLIASLDRERTDLAAAREGLLPRLISGQIRVSDTTDPNEVIAPVAETVEATAS